MEGTYNNPYAQGQSPLTPNTPSGGAYKVNVNRAKTRKWVEAKVQNYDGDDWGDEYSDDDEEPEPVPQPVSRVTTGLRPVGQRLPSETHRPSPRLAEIAASGSRSASGPPSLQLQTGQHPTIPAEQAVPAIPAHLQDSPRSTPSPIGGRNASPIPLPSQQRQSPAPVHPAEPRSSTPHSQNSNTARSSPLAHPLELARAEEDRKSASSPLSTRDNVIPRPADGSTPPSGEAGHQVTNPPATTTLGDSSPEKRASISHSLLPDMKRLSIFSSDFFSSSSASEPKDTKPASTPDKPSDVPQTGSGGNEGGAKIVPEHEPQWNEPSSSVTGPVVGLKSQAPVLPVPDPRSVPPLRTPSPNATGITPPEPASSTSARTMRSDITPTEPLQPRRPDHSPSDYEPRPLQQEPVLNVSTSSPVKESDVLSDEILRTLSPAGVTPPALAPGAESSKQLVPGNSRQGTRSSSYTLSDYDSYWADSPDKPAPEATETITTTVPAPQPQEPPQVVVPQIDVPPQEPVTSPSGDDGPGLRRRFSWEGDFEHNVKVLKTEAPSDGPPNAGIPSTNTPSSLGQSDIQSPKDVVSDITSPRSDTPKIVIPPLSDDSPAPQPQLQPSMLEPPSPVSTREETVSQDTEDRRPSVLSDSALSQTPSHPVSDLSTLEPQPTITDAAPLVKPRPIPEVKGVREIMAMDNSEDRIKQYEESRKAFAETDLGLETWLLAIKQQHPEYANMTSSFNGTKTQTFAGGNTASASGSAAQAQAPYYQQYLNASSPTTTAPPSGRSRLAGLPLSTQAATSAFGNSSNQIGTKSKEFMHSAGKMGKGLFSKGRSKLRGTGDKGEPIPPPVVHHPKAKKERRASWSLSIGARSRTEPTTTVDKEKKWLSGYYPPSSSQSRRMHPFRSASWGSEPGRRRVSLGSLSSRISSSRGSSTSRIVNDEDASGSHSRDRDRDRQDAEVTVGSTASVDKDGSLRGRWEAFKVKQRHHSQPLLPLRRQYDEPDEPEDQQPRVESEAAPAATGEATRDDASERSSNSGVQLDGHSRHSSVHPDENDQDETMAASIDESEDFSFTDDDWVEIVTPHSTAASIRLVPAEPALVEARPSLSLTTHSHSHSQPRSRSQSQSQTQSQAQTPTPTPFQSHPSSASASRGESRLSLTPVQTPVRSHQPSISTSTGTSTGTGTGTNASAGASNNRPGIGPANSNPAAAHQANTNNHAGGVGTGGITAGQFANAAPQPGQMPGPQVQAKPQSQTQSPRSPQSPQQLQANTRRLSSSVQTLSQTNKHVNPPTRQRTKEDMSFSSHHQQQQQQQLADDIPKRNSSFVGLPPIRRGSTFGMSPSAPSSSASPAAFASTSTSQAARPATERFSLDDDEQPPHPQPYPHPPLPSPHPAAAPVSVSGPVVPAAAPARFPGNGTVAAAGNGAPADAANSATSHHPPPPPHHQGGVALAKQAASMPFQPDGMFPSSSAPPEQPNPVSDSMHPPRLPASPEGQQQSYHSPSGPAVATTAAAGGGGGAPAPMIPPNMAGNPIQKLPPSGPWKLEESHLSEPLHIVARNRADTAGSQQQPYFGYDKETGVTLPPDSLAAPTASSSPRPRPKASEVPPSSTRRYPDLFTGPRSRSNSNVNAPQPTALPGQPLQGRPSQELALPRAGTAGYEAEGSEETGRRKSSGFFNRFTRPSSDRRGSASAEPNVSQQLQPPTGPIDDRSESDLAADEMNQHPGQRKPPRGSFLFSLRGRASMDQPPQGQPAQPHGPLQAPPPIGQDQRPNTPDSQSGKKHSRLSAGLGAITGGHVKIKPSGLPRSSTSSMVNETGNPSEQMGPPKKRFSGLGAREKVGGVFHRQSIDVIQQPATPGAMRPSTGAATPGHPGSMAPPPPIGGGFQRSNTEGPPYGQHQQHMQPAPSSPDRRKRRGSAGGLISGFLGHKKTQSQNEFNGPPQGQPQALPQQLPPGQNPLGQHPPGRSPLAQPPLTQPGQFPPGQFPPGQFPPGHPDFRPNHQVRIPSGQPLNGQFSGMAPQLPPLGPVSPVQLQREMSWGQVTPSQTPPPGQSPTRPPALRRMTGNSSLDSQPQPGAERPGSSGVNPPEQGRGFVTAGEQNASQVSLNHPQPSPLKQDAPVVSSLHDSPRLPHTAAALSDDASTHLRSSSRGVSPTRSVPISHISNHTSKHSLDTAVQQGGVDITEPPRPTTDSPSLSFRSTQPGHTRTDSNNRDELPLSPVSQLSRTGPPSIASSNLGQSPRLPSVSAAAARRGSQPGTPTIPIPSNTPPTQNDSFSPRVAPQQQQSNPTSPLQQQRQGLPSPGLQQQQRSQSPFQQRQQHALPSPGFQPQHQSHPSSPLQQQHQPPASPFQQQEQKALSSVAPQPQQPRQQQGQGQQKPLPPPAVQQQALGPQQGNGPSRTQSPSLNTRPSFQTMPSSASQSSIPVSRPSLQLAGPQHPKDDYRPPPAMLNPASGQAGPSSKWKGLRNRMSAQMVAKQPHDQGKPDGEKKMSKLFGAFKKASKTPQPGQQQVQSQGQHNQPGFLHHHQGNHFQETPIQQQMYAPGQQLRPGQVMPPQQMMVPAQQLSPHGQQMPLMQQMQFRQGQQPMPVGPQQQFQQLHSQQMPSGQQIHSGQPFPPGQQQPRPTQRQSLGQQVPPGQQVAPGQQIRPGQPTPFGPQMITGQQPPQQVPLQQTRPQQTPVQPALPHQAPPGQQSPPVQQQQQFSPQVPHSQSFASRQSSQFGSPPLGQQSFQHVNSASGQQPRPSGPPNGQFVGPAGPVQQQPGPPGVISQQGTPQGFRGPPQRQPQQQRPGQKFTEPQYDQVPIPMGYVAVHGEGRVEPSLYNVGRNLNHQGSFVQMPPPQQMQPPAQPVQQPPQHVFSQPQSPASTTGPPVLRAQPLPQQQTPVSQPASPENGGRVSISSGYQNVQGETIASATPRGGSVDGSWQAPPQVQRVATNHSQVPPQVQRVATNASHGSSQSSGTSNETPGAIVHQNSVSALGSDTQSNEPRSPQPQTLSENGFLKPQNATTPPSLSVGSITPSREAGSPVNGQDGTGGHNSRPISLSPPIGTDGKISPAFSQGHSSSTTSDEPSTIAYTTNHHPASTENIGNDATHGVKLHGTGQSHENETPRGVSNGALLRTQTRNRGAPAELEDTTGAHARKLRLAGQEEKIHYDPDADSDGEPPPQMSATSYPGQEWNPYGMPEFGEWND